MIRDPSDGSVKEQPKPAPDRKVPRNTAERLPSSDAASSGAGAVSGLPDGSTKPKDLARLEASREWLKNYLHRK